MTNPNAIPITSLTLEQLYMVKSQLEEETQTLTDSLRRLMVANSRLADSKESLSSLQSGGQGREIMVPLTSSLYVKGTVASIDSVTVDIGTGYYIEKSVDEGQAYLDRKLNIVQENVARVQEAMQQKKKSMDSIVGVMQQKILQAQQQASSSSSSTSSK
ncbi:Prefoldin subunit 5 [Balamuthia mandrillaris]